MAYYIVNFEGRRYMSRDLFLALHGTTSFTLPKLGKDRTKLIFDVLVFGPSTEEEEKKVVDSGFAYTVQDIDAQVAGLVKADGKEQTIELRLPQEHIVKYHNRRYIKIAYINDARKYRFLSRFATVRVCGRGIYVCLDSKDKDNSDPIVITEKK